MAQFGQFVGNFTPDNAVTNFLAPYPPVEIFQVAGALPETTVSPAAGALRVYGGPQSLLTLADEGLLGERPVLLNGDGAGQPVAGSVVTESLRRRVRNFGEVDSGYSPTLTGTQPAVTFDATDDYTEPGWDKYQAVAEYTGIKNVTASSSASDIQAIPSQWASGLLPFAAVPDGDMRTRWESGSWTGPVGQWIQADFDSPVDPARSSWPSTTVPRSARRSRRSGCRPPLVRSATRSPRPARRSRSASRTGHLAGCGSRSPASVRSPARLSAPRWAFTISRYRVSRPAGRYSPLRFPVLTLRR